MSFSLFSFQTIVTIPNLETLPSTPVGGFGAVLSVSEMVTVSDVIAVLASIFRGIKYWYSAPYVTLVS